MFVVFEEDGGFKLGRIMQDQNTTLQVESLHGKRVKVKRPHVVLEFKEPELNLVHQQAEAEQTQLDVSFLWETCPPEAELSFSQIARDYYGRIPTPGESLAILQTLHSAPIYFHRRGKGQYRAAPETAVRAALAGLARRSEEATRIQHWSQELQNKTWPADWSDATRTMLLYKPDRQQLPTKALEAACDALHCDTLTVLRECKAIESAHDYHFGKFLHQYFPKGTHWNELPALESSHLLFDSLPKANVQAFSLDDISTTEVDDAFSLTSLGSGLYEVGIHIAVPALLITPNSDWDTLARTRYSTVYMPGQKITMLPEELIQRFSLNEGNCVPALSLYVQCNEAGEILSHRTLIERVDIAANLRHEYLPDAYFDQDDASWEHYSAHASTLKTLFQLAHKVYERRGKLDTSRADYSFIVEHPGSEDERIRIEQRARGSRPDRLVSEWMIVANTLWSGLLAQAKAPAFYRVQMGGKVKTSSHADAHQGLNVPHYMWSTSPLRRYADLLNQQQLLAFCQGETLPYIHTDSRFLQAMSEFEVTYNTYAQFQDQMEHYWCLRWLEQEGITHVNATTTTREAMARLDRLPLVVKVQDLPASCTPGTHCQIRLTHMDTWLLHSAWQFHHSLIDQTDNVETEGSPA